MSDEDFPDWILELPSKSIKDLRVRDDTWQFKLRKSREIDGIPCAADTPIMGDQKGLRKGTLAASWEYRGVQLPGETEFEFKGPFRVLECDVEGSIVVYGHFFRELKKITFPFFGGREQTSFLIWLAMVFSSHFMRRVRYYKNRIPAILDGSFVPLPYDCSVLVGEESDGPDFDFFRGDRVWLNREGYISKMYLSRYREFNKLLIYSGSVCFDEKQNVRLCRLEYPQYIHGFPCRGGGTPIEFHSNGSFRRLVLSEPKVIDGTKYSRGTVLTFNRRGILQEAAPYEEYFDVENSEEEEPSENEPSEEGQQVENENGESTEGDQPQDSQGSDEDDPEVEIVEQSG